MTFHAFPVPCTTRWSASRGATLRVVEPIPDEMKEIRDWILGAERVVVLTGAGISTDSGIPDFRGPNGVWTKDPEAEAKSDISYYLSDPELRRKAWKRRVERPVTAAKPNPGHQALRALERRGQLHLLITQNVDGLHLAAGHDPSLVVEIHGSSREVMCMSCDDRAPIEKALDRVRAGEEDPPCRNCGGILKPAIISFGQSLVADDLIRAELAARSCDLLLAVGSTLGVYPAAAVVPIAKRSGARVVILNAEPTDLDHIADAVIRGQISELLPVLVGADDASGDRVTPDDREPDGTEAHF